MARSTINKIQRSTIYTLTIIAAVSLSTFEALALPANRISQLAKEFTVLLDSESPGTGVILSKNDSKYTVLTAAHVVEYSDYKYNIRTPDQAIHPVQYKNVKKLPGVDLAIVEFNSDRLYPTAQIANSDETTEGSPVYIAGFPDPGTATEDRIFQFTSGEISSRPTTGPKGYLMHYTNITRVGMSGGPVLNSEGKLVGIHGLANTDPDSGSKTGINLGIPINSFLKLSEKIGFKLPTILPKLSTEKETPPNISLPKIPAIQSTDPPLNIPKVLQRRPKPIRPGNSSSPICAGVSC
jgi:S1-C subfamily serine protease